MFILDKTVSIQRLTVVLSDSDKEQYQEVGNMHNVAMNIQPATPELTAVSEGVYGQTFQAFTAVSGIKIGDRVTVSGTSEKFIVKGINNWYNAVLPHLEITLFKEDN